MAKERKILNRMQVIRSTRKITQAMKMVATVKLEKTKKKLATLVTYASPLQQLFGQFMQRPSAAIQAAFFTPRVVKKSLWLIITSDRGLCGAFNHSVLRGIKAIYEDKIREGEMMQFMPIGAKGLSLLKHKGLPYLPSHVDLSRELQWKQVRALSRLLTKFFLAKEYDCIKIRYQSNSSCSKVCTKQLFPLLPVAAGETDFKQEMLCEPNREAIVNTLLPEVIALNFYHCLLKAHVVEHKVRMLSMVQATDNADDLLKTLKLSYNRLRQDTITKGIIEVVAGL